MVILIRSDKHALLTHYMLKKDNKRISEKNVLPFVTYDKFAYAVLFNRATH